MTDSLHASGASPALGVGLGELVAFVSTSEPNRARNFYEQTLGLRLVSESPFALVFEATKTTLRVTVVDRVAPAPCTVLGWSVSDIARSARTLAGRGVTFLRYGSVQQDELGIWRSPSGAQIAWFEDPDGNLLSLTQF